MNKEEIILEIKKVELEKLKKNKKKVDHIKKISETSLGTDLDQMRHLIAKLNGDEIAFFYRDWICDTRGIGGGFDDKRKDTPTTLEESTVEELEKLLSSVKKNNIVL